MKKTIVRHPYAKVEFATETGALTIFQQLQQVDKSMDFDIINIETKRDIGNDDCATFTMNLVYKESWYNSISGNDLVIIRLGDGTKEKPIFFGLVDNIYESESYPDLIPTRSLTVSGRGFNKALIQFGVGAITELQKTAAKTGFFPGQRDVLTQNSPAKVIETAYNYYTQKGIDINFANGESFKSLAQTIFKENEEDKESCIGDEQFYINYQGGLWEYLKELRNAPFYEIYWEVMDDKPTLMVRPTPFNPEEWDKLETSTVENYQVVTKNLGRSDLETYTCFIVKGEQLNSGFIELFGKPLWYPPFYKKYGLRKLQVNSKYNYMGEVPSIETTSDPSNNSNEIQQTEMKDMGGQFPFPLPNNTRISSKFGYRTHPVTGKKGSFHTGIDIPAPNGTPIPSVGDGIVKNVGWNNLSGHWIEIQHNNGIVTRYQHCNSKPKPLKGDKIKQGQVIANVGNTGRGTGNHLHFEVKVNGKAVDPMPYIKGGTPGKGAKGDAIEKTLISKVEWDKNSIKEQQKSVVFKSNKKSDEDIFKSAEKNYAEQSIKRAVLDPTGFNTPELNLENFIEEEQDKATKEEAEELQSVADSVVSKKTINLFNWNILNNQMENGSIILLGDVDYKIGTKLYVKETDMEYYIENVTQSFTYNESWTTTLQLTRGFKKGKRFDPPWNAYEVMTEADLLDISGISTMGANATSESSSTEQASSESKIANATNLSTDRKKLVSQFLSKAGETYSQGSRMKDGYSDCSSFVYKRVCEAIGIDYKGTWAPSTSNMASSKLWEEIPINEALPGDILWRPGHTEFVSDEGMNGRSFGAHKPGTPSGYGGKISNGKWKKAYRVKGIR